MLNFFAICTVPDLLQTAGKKNTAPNLSNWDLSKGLGTPMFSIILSEEYSAVSMAMTSPHQDHQMP